MGPFLLLWALLCIAAASPEAEPTAVFPLQFSANLEITSHLIDNDSEYPPKTRRMTIYFDYEARKARADIEAGYEAAKIYIRRYDSNREYMVRLPPIDDCKRSYLGETMPFPDISFARFVKVQTVHDVLCNYFIIEEEDETTRIHIYMRADTNEPVRLLEESFDKGVSTALLSYDFSDFILTAPSADWFELPEGLEHGTCDRHVGGFPYLHIFHHFVKF